VKFSSMVGCSGRTNRLDFGGNLDHNPDPKFLYPDRDQDSGFFSSLFTIAISIDSRKQNVTLLVGGLRSSALWLSMCQYNTVTQDSFDWSHLGYRVNVTTLEITRFLCIGLREMTTGKGKTNPGHSCHIAKQPALVLLRCQLIL